LFLYNKDTGIKEEYDIRPIAISVWD
jgi:hypothetical protein